MHFEKNSFEKSFQDCLEMLFRRKPPQLIQTHVTQNALNALSEKARAAFPQLFLGFSTVFPQPGSFSSALPQLSLSFSSAYDRGSQEDIEEDIEETRR